MWRCAGPSRRFSGRRFPRLDIGAGVVSIALIDKALSQIWNWTMRKIFLVVFLSSLTAAARAELISQPSLSPNDSWSYHVRVQNCGAIKDSHVTISVTRVGSDGVVVSEKSNAAPDRVASSLFGSDWSKRRGVNGLETTVNRPLAFPLEVGKSWRVEFTEQNPNPQKLSETDVLPYKVVGWEDVTVPAGKFHALKIESLGRWMAELSPRVVNNAAVARWGSVATRSSESRIIKGVRVSGRYYKCFWYVPNVKRWVKSIEENYSSNDSLSQSMTTELESFDVGGGLKPEGAPHHATPVLPPPAPPPAKNSI